MTSFPLKGELYTQQPFSPLSPLHMDILVVYIQYSICSEFMYLGLGLFWGGRCCKDKQNLCPLHKQMQRTTCSAIKLPRFWTKHTEMHHIRRALLFFTNRAAGTSHPAGFACLSCFTQEHCWVSTATSLQNAARFGATPTRRSSSRKTAAFGTSSFVLPDCAC